MTAPVSLICNTRILALFENLTTGLATAFRYSFAAEAGGLSPRLCIVRDFTLCETVSATYTAYSSVNIAEVGARGGWTGGYAAPLDSFEAARIVKQSSSKARVAPRGRGLTVAYNSSDIIDLQLLLNAASLGVVSIDAVITTTTSNVGQVVACLISSGCTNGNFSGVPPVNISMPSYGGVVTLSNNETAEDTTGVWAVAQVISALANATNSSAAVFSGFVNLTATKISFELVTPAASTGLQPHSGGGTTNASFIALVTVGSLGALGVLAFAMYNWRKAVLKRLLPAAQRPKDNAAQHGSDSSDITLILRG